MARDEDVSKPDGDKVPHKREPISPVLKRRLDKAFEHATKQVSQDNFEYASELLTQCILGDPLNIQYVRNYIENLQKKYKNNRKGAAFAHFQARGARSALKKAEAQGEWNEVLTSGIAVLKVNPWDVPTLRSMAAASGHLGDRECQMHYLKCALESHPKDPETNIQCAKALSDMGQYDQAIACWHRVEQARPGDEEASRSIATLAVRKTVKQGGFEDQEKEKEKKAKAAKQAKQGAGQAAQAEEEPSEEDILRKKIAQRPKDIANYLELGQLLLNKENYDEAEKLYAKAFEVSKEDPDIRERWTDVQVQRMRHRAAEAREHRKESPEAEQQYRSLRKELIDKELDRCKFLCARYPNNLRFKFDLGVQYQYAKQYGEAIKEYQQAKNDPRCKGLCLLGLGQCFQLIKQHRLAMRHYELAIEEISDRDAANKREALYLAGKMAIDELKDLNAADKHLSALAGLDFTYKDVAALLDRLSSLREEQEQPGEQAKGD